MSEEDIVKTLRQIARMLGQALAPLEQTKRELEEVFGKELLRSLYSLPVKQQPSLDEMLESIKSSLGLEDENLDEYLRKRFGTSRNSDKP